MTYQDDPNGNLRRSTTTSGRNTNYTGWIIGGIVALVVIIGIFVMSGGTDKTNTALNPPVTTTTPGTTGSGSATPAKPSLPAR
jgi:hypothetical protein